MAGNARRIVVEFIGEDRNLSATARKVEGTTGKLGGRLGKVGAIAGGVMAAGLLAGGAALVKAGKAAIDDQAAATKLATALKNTTGATDKQVASVEKWISAQGKALGVTDDELRPALNTLVTATGDVGKAQSLAALAMDVSAGKGKSLESVSTALAKAQNGNVGALGRLGVATKDAAGNTLSFEQIQKNLAKTFKGQAAAGANTLAGRIDRLKLQFNETVEAIGYKLLPVAEKFVGWVVDDAIPAVSKLAKFLQAKFGPVIDRVRGFLAKLGKDGQSSSSKFGKMAASIRSAMKSISSIISSTVSIIKSLWKAFGEDLTKYATTSFKNIVTVVSGALKVVAGIFKVVASLLKGDWKGLWDGLKMIASGAMQIIRGLVSQGMNSIRTALSAAATAMKAIFAGAWNGIKSIVSSGVNAVINSVKAIPGKILALGGAMKNAGKALMQSLLDGIAKAAGFVSNFASGVWNAIRRLINSGISKLNSALEFTIKLPLGLGSFRINPPNIPALYQGGIVPGSKYGTPIIAGDGGHPEAIVPLSGPHAPNFGGGGDVHITLTLDSEVVHRALVRRKRNIGRELGLA